MRFAIATSDRFIGVYDAFLTAGWIPVKVFISPVENEPQHHQAVLAMATASMACTIG